MPGEFYANQHTNSTHSAGQFTPTELARIAKADGYQALALTDYDTITGTIYDDFVQIRYRRISR